MYPDIVVWLEIILDIALWVKSKMSSIWARFNYKYISFLTEWTQIHDFGIYSEVFRYAQQTRGVDPMLG